jgi:hypothetical protein
VSKSDFTAAWTESTEATQHRDEMIANILAAIAILTVDNAEAVHDIERAGNFVGRSDGDAKEAAAISDASSTAAF